MRQKRGYRIEPFTRNRRFMAAHAAVFSEQSTYHEVTEIDISEPRRRMREYRERTGETLSMTAYVAACLGRAIAEHPRLNSVRRGRRLFILDDVTIALLIERVVGEEQLPEPFGLVSAQTKSVRQIHDEIRAAQQVKEDRLGDLFGIHWIRFIPCLLLRPFIRIGSRWLLVRKRIGAVSLTAVGMFGRGPLWLLPLSGATVIVSVGGIMERPVLRDGRLEAREHLCITASFDHDIVDGAPAARFMRTFSEYLECGDLLREALLPGEARG